MLTGEPKKASANTKKKTSRKPKAKQDQAPQVAMLPPVHLDLTLNINRDPFVNSHIIPPPPVKDDTKPDKVIVPKVPDKKELYDKLLKTAQSKLKLAGTVQGANPRALINGQLYNINSEIDGFKIVKIELRKIVVQKEGFLFPVNMAN